jgi:hypothetical protein
MVTSWVEINENIDIGSSTNLNLRAIISTILIINFNFIKKKFVLYFLSFLASVFHTRQQFLPRSSKNIPVAGKEIYS